MQLSKVFPIPFTGFFSGKGQSCSAWAKGRHLLPGLQHLLNCKGLRESYWTVCLSFSHCH